MHWNGTSPAVMAAALRLRSAVCSIVVYLLVSLIVCKLAECPQKRSRDERLSKLTAAKTVNTVNIKAVKPLGDKQVSKKARSQTTGSVKLINAMKLLNMALAANLILLSNDVSLNPGPTQPLPSLMKGLRLFHLNICSKQTITEPTRITEETRTLIDLFLTSRPELYTCGVIPIGFSDHCAIFGVRKLHNIKRPPPKIIQSRNYKNYDPAFFSDDLNKIPWDILEMESTSNEAWIVFKDLFLTVADKHAPVATRRVRGFSVPWLTSSIKELMTERDYHHKKAIKTNQELHWSKYKRLRNTVSKKMKKAISDYYSSRLRGDST